MPHTVSLSSIDRILNIHQSVKLEQVVNLNKELLNAQLRQNQKLNILNNQLAEANNLSKQILHNQITELRRVEEQRFYKSLAFNCMEIIDLIATINNSILQSYFALSYADKLKANLNIAKETLEEISDKTEVKKYMERFNTISAEVKSEEFLESPLSELNNKITEYQGEEAVFDRELNDLQKKIKSIKIPSQGLFGFNKKARLSALSERFEQESKYQRKLEEKQLALDNHRLKDAFKQVMVTFPDLDRFTDEIIVIENIFKNKFDVITKAKIDSQSENSKNDPLFEDAARLIVMHQQGSTSLIQRKLKLGYNRAGRIIDQLETAGIVGPLDGSKSREVLFRDVLSLEKFLGEDA